MTPAETVEFVTQGTALVALWWELRQLRNDVHSLREELNDDVKDLRVRVQRLELAHQGETP